MKKKYLLLTFLALAIITSLTAGTLAIYTSANDLAATEVTAKKFAFSSAKSAGYSQSVKLAPTESQDYPFTVTNLDGTTPSEVPMYYTINVDIDEVIAAMPGLTVELLNGDIVVATSKASDITWGGDAEGKTHFSASVGATHNYKLRLNWVSDGSNNVAQTKAGNDAAIKEFKVSLAATQDTTP